MFVFGIVLSLFCVMQVGLYGQCTMAQYVNTNKSNDNYNLICIFENKIIVKLTDDNLSKATNKSDF